MLDLFGDEKILALWWKEPYCSLMLPPVLKVETRTWNTNYRGIVLGCASKNSYTFDMVNHHISGSEYTNRAFEALNYQEFPPTKYCGNAVWIGRLVNCRLMTKADEAKCFVQYREPWIEVKKLKDGTEKKVLKKLYCHFYHDVKPIMPFELKGAQGWRIVTPEIKSKIKFL